MSSMVSKVPTAARIALGAIFVVFGLNGFLHFLPQPALPGGALGFLGGLASTGYFFPLLKGTEILAGLLLLSNRFVPLALAVLAPIVVNIVAFHAFLAPAGVLLPLAVLGLELYLAWAYRPAFRAMLVAGAKPSAPRAALVEEGAHAAAE